MARQHQVRAVAFQEGGMWVVQGVEYDVVTQTKNLSDAPRAFLRTLISTMLVNRKLGRDGFAHMSPAPDRFREMFETAQAELNPVGPLPADGDIARPNISMRLYDQQAA